MGLVTCGESESLLIYGMAMSFSESRISVLKDSLLADTFGVYVSKHGYLTRGRQYVRWETRVTAFASRPPYVLLFSSEWVEVRHATTGRLEQVVHGTDIRLIQAAQSDGGSLLLAMRGDTDDASGLSDKLMEAVETRPLEIGRQAETFTDPQWDEWGI